ncbi:undecaprenyl-phosphate galactosephosphotransferase [Candidatus Magnetobacterium bavaricum]|uniref:Undecaprenyl-phosphate galactosephosphotransferase n=1 Tax=Candidatus Magnetobacterium bavaricum TaxID=29290 RepID=A0A0F3GMH0_9BACT|nr:undecaprenyl-phosphate galactosephosphotransferase [Candidatus Magnetobacterium bavaricum]
MTNYRLQKAVVPFFDIASIYISIFIAHLLRHKGLVLSQTINDMTLWVVTIFTAFYIFDLYDLSFRKKLIMRLLLGVLCAAIGIMLFSFVFYKFFIGRGLLAMQTVGIFFLTTMLRLLMYNIRHKINKPVRVVLYGPEEFVGKVSRNLDKSDKVRIDKTVFYGSKLDKKLTCKGLKRADSPVIVFVDTPKIPPLLFQHLLECRMKGMVVREMSDFYEDVLERVPIYFLEDRWFLYSRGFTVIHNDFYIRAKRLIDVLLSITFIILLAPFMLLVALIIKLESNGPALYMQKRVGQNEEPFKLRKFRSMVRDAEKNGPAWAAVSDPRITKVGRVIRRLRIDELPQLFNILKGEMSFVGPRPERPAFISQLQEQIPYYSFRHIVKPGLTGWAQINYKYGASIEDAAKKLEYDIYYIKNFSLIFDIQIILRTIRVVLFGEEKGGILNE